MVYNLFNVIQYLFVIYYIEKFIFYRIFYKALNIFHILSFTGKIDLEELIRAFKELGIEIAQEEATKLLQR